VPVIEQLLDQDMCSCANTTTTMCVNSSEALGTAAAVAPVAAHHRSSMNQRCMRFHTS
jgi:hypothetical protein